MAEFASNAKGNAALTTGIIGTAGVALPLLSGLLGGMGWNGNGGCCNEDHFVNRYEATQSARIAELETEVKLRDANTFTMGEMNKLRDYVDGRFTGIEAQICQQNVYNATNTAAIACINGQIAQLMGLTKTVIPNTSICPGWGNVTVTPSTTTTGA